MDSRSKLLALVDDGHFSFESLLGEIVAGMSTQEAEEMLEHICDMHGIEQGEN